jgi:shikimate dehydrogenase
VAEPVLRATTRTAAVIGHPVAHSLSPVIHNAAFAACEVDWAYLAFDVAPGGGAAAVEAMRTLHLGGLSVTMPHKGDVAGAVDRCTPAARCLGAVNCVAWEQGELVGHNTDGDGFVDSLVPALDRPLSELRCLVFGAGGAARSVIVALAGAGAAEVAVCNRTPRRAESAAALAGSAGTMVAPAAARDYDVIVNATSLGMAGTSGAGMSPVDPAMVHDGQIVVDLVYNPLRTRLLAGAAARGAITLDGVGMLVHQAARQFSLWTGLEAPIAAMEAAARNGVADRS